jgi:hypothetical protein
MTVFSVKYIYICVRGLGSVVSCVPWTLDLFNGETYVANLSWTCIVITLCSIVLALKIVIG